VGKASGFIGGFKERHTRRPGGWRRRRSSAPERSRFLGMLQAAIQPESQVLQGDLPLSPELAVEPREDLEEVEAQHENQEPGDDRHRVVMGTVFQATKLGQFVERMVLDSPPLVADAPDGPRGIGSNSGLAIQRQW